MLQDVAQQKTYIDFASFVYSQPVDNPSSSTSLLEQKSIRINDPGRVGNDGGGRRWNMVG